MSTDIDAEAIAGGRWRLHPRVALRPEPFGALAYHYGNRRLNFLRSPDLVTVVESLGDAPSVIDTLEACAIDPRRHQAFTRALAALARSDFLVPVDDANLSTATTETR
ncbi:MAG: mycofactocin biosynthesis chaperone MftB [Actinomycetota bacterium]